MGADAWVTVAVTAVAVVAMARDRVEPALGLGGALGVLVLAGAVSPAGALAGFSSTAVAVVGLLLVLAGSLEGSPWVTRLGDLVFGPAGGRWGLSRSLPPVAALSAFLSNTTVVATLVPAVREWCRRVEEAPSKYLIPLSFAAILGGTATLIGTSTNLVVHGMLAETGSGLGMFELLPVAAPVTVAGLLYLIFLGYGLLPAREDPLEAAAKDTREYLARLRVKEGCSLVGTAAAEFEEDEEILLAGLERGGVLNISPNPELEVQVGDVLILAGMMEAIVELAALEGLTPATGEPREGGLLPGDRHHLVEAVISPSAPFVGQNIREAAFRAHHDAVVLAVHRHGERIVGEVGDIRLRAGDTLLLLAGPDFHDRWRYAREFYLLSDVGQLRRSIRPRDWFEPAVLLGVVLLPALGLLSLLKAAMAGVIVLIVSGRLRPGEVWSKLDWSVLVIIGAAIGLGNAFVESGLAGAVGHGITRVGGAFGPVGLVLAVLVATSLMTEVITNVAAVALMFPIAMVAAEATGMGTHALAVSVAIGGSASFLTPLAYQTNTMVAGAGNYSFGEFFKVGAPLKLVYLAVAAAVIPAVW